MVNSENRKNYEVLRTTFLILYFILGIYSTLHYHNIELSNLPVVSQNIELSLDSTIGFCLPIHTGAFKEIITPDIRTLVSILNNSEFLINEYNFTYQSESSHYCYLRGPPPIV